MSRSRIAVFEGYGAPLFNNPRPGLRGYGFDPRRMPAGMGGPLFNNPRLGRRPYRVPPLYESSPYGPVTEGGRRAKRLVRKGYKVKKGRNSAAQVRFKKIAKLCARKAKGRNARKGTYQTCMRQKLKKKGKR